MADTSLLSEEEHNAPGRYRDRSVRDVIPMELSAPVEDLAEGVITPDFDPLFSCFFVFFSGN